ncbi:MAG: hypothetical protein KAV40_06120 [Thermoplasmatales archaeon]|nr:hypothetical protein [Thermoplasmatales archaeon]
MRKLLKVSFIVVLLLQVSTVNVLIGVAQSPKQNQPYVLPDGLPDIHIDLSSRFREMGYTAENITSVSRDLVIKVLISYCEDNPFGYETEPSISFTPESRDFFSEDNSVNEYNFGAEDSVVSEVSPQGVMTNGETKACVSCVVWDYPGEENDLGWYIEHAAEDFLYEDAADYGDYDIVFNNLENSIATRDNMDTVLEYFFDNYDNVDLYFMGHGGRSIVWIIWPFWYTYEQYYCPYDSIDADTGEVILDSVFWEDDLTSDNPLWDSSPMRLVMLTSCWGWGFRQEALNPGGSTSHDRAFMGKNGIGYTDYTYYYMEKWCDLWYQYSWDSSSAAAEARDYAWDESTQQGVNMSYTDTGSSIYC